MARKVVGVGSVGTRCLIGLFLGHSDDDVLVLQFKEADALGARALRRPQPATGSSGARVVNGQRLVQVASDVFLGWNALEEGQHYYWRQLRDMKASAEIGTLGQKQFDAYVRACAWCLAHAHARSGDPIAIAAYLGVGDAFDQAMGAFARRLRRPDEGRLEGAEAGDRRGRRHAPGRISDLRERGPQ